MINESIIHKKPAFSLGLIHYLPQQSSYSRVLFFAPLKFYLIKVAYFLRDVAKNKLA